MATSGLIAALQSIPDALVAMGVGLIGVALARWVFVNRESRRLGKREGWRETLPLTLTAMLITGAIIWDRGLGISGAAFTGLGVGWVAVLLLDVLGERVMAVLRAGLAAGPASPSFPPAADISGEGGKVTSADVDLPPDMADSLRLLDAIPSRQEPPDDRPNPPK